MRIEIYSSIALFGSPVLVGLSYKYRYRIDLKICYRSITKSVQ